MATPLGPEKYVRIDFSLGRWTTMGQNAPKLELKHAKEQVELVRIFRKVTPAALKVNVKKF